MRGRAVTSGRPCYLAGDIETSRDVWQQALAILGDLKHPDATDVRAKLADLDRRCAVR
jgi:hypothetical protein